MIPIEFPKLRPVDIRPSSQRIGHYDLTDASGLAPGGLALSPAALSAVMQMDGRRRRVEIQAEFMRRHGTMLFSDDLDRMIEQLQQALFLEGPFFEAHLADLTRQYRAASCRPLWGDAATEPRRLADYFNEVFGKSPPASPDAAGLLGLVAPHLDYKRGRPCYASAYRGLAERTMAKRFVLLGTNHFGRGAGVVGTRKHFETSFGIVEHDAVFLKRLEDRCRVDLCEYEYDHVREHSIELQVQILKHLLPDRPFTIVPFLCPDICGPSGTAPAGGRGVDLRTFAEALRAELAAEPVPTCVVAGADLSHVGRYFHDDRELDADTLHALESSDRRLLEDVLRLDAEGLRKRLAEAANPTHICSAGCLYVLTHVLRGRAAAHLLGYHQAVTAELENCVTCAALEFAQT